jgi:hypothetical protein
VLTFLEKVACSLFSASGMSIETPSPAVAGLQEAQDKAESS